MDDILLTLQVTAWFQVGTAANGLRLRESVKMWQGDLNLRCQEKFKKSIGIPERHPTAYMIPSSVTSTSTRHPEAAAPVPRKTTVSAGCR